MIIVFKKLIHKTARYFGFQIINTRDPIIDSDTTFMAIYTTCKPYTMTSKERMYALYKAVNYIIQKNIPGDFVECGVWRGGSVMLIAHTLLSLDVTDRKIYLYDTFSGMTKPEIDDFKLLNPSKHALHKWQKEQETDKNKWCFASMQEVTENMSTTLYPSENVMYVKGRVEDTLLTNALSHIALLRLDTDWYSSTKYELTHLYPLLSTHGILIIDDYGDWAGARKAVDEYFSESSPLFHRIDRGGRIGIKI